MGSVLDLDILNVPYSINDDRKIFGLHTHLPRVRTQRNVKQHLESVVAGPSQMNLKFQCYTAIQLPS